jgi:hypothetical protein
MRILLEPNVKILNRYIMLGRAICEKYQSRDEQFPEPKGDGNLVSRLEGNSVSRLVFFAIKYHSQT